VIALAGMWVAGASLVAVLVMTVWLLVRASSSVRRINAVPSRRAVRAIGQIGGCFDRIALASSTFGEMNDRWIRIASAVGAVVESSVLLSADVRRVADATEELLDVFVPSLRGCAAGD
jgi:hypothetical protein